MTFALNHYVKIKDNYCICYFGPEKDYVEELVPARLIIKKQLPELKVYLCVRDDFMYLLENEERVFPKSKMEDFKPNMAHVRILEHKVGSNPVHELMKESKMGPYA